MLELVKEKQKMTGQSSNLPRLHIEEFLVS